ncbi:hypothetical protein [Posidoniimonas polymericola]|uniref:hypothetical protein n=1 Tax=Posidoniimonas polymericola TaxID=2528002 RepID=UPI0011B715EE|nr:hypothetical protein [Posidoniimonas polymericola]
MDEPQSSRRTRRRIKINIVKRTGTRVLGVALVIAISPLLIALALVGLLCWCIGSALLLLVAWVYGVATGRDTLIVFSNSPYWESYFKETVIPILDKRSQHLNCSESKRWAKASLPVVLYRWFGGSKQNNPLAMVFRPWRTPAVFRFYIPFRNAKHGKPDQLLAVIEQLSQAVGKTIPPPSQLSPEVSL